MKEYYSIKEAVEYGVPFETVRHWCYVTREAEKKEVTVERWMIPANIIERWENRKHKKCAKNDNIAL